MACIATAGLFPLLNTCFFCFLPAFKNSDEIWQNWDCMEQVLYKGADFHIPSTEILKQPISNLSRKRTSSKAQLSIEVSD